jgi:hypothetical protein
VEPDEGKRTERRVVQEDGHNGFHGTGGVPPREANAGKTKL